MASEREPGSNRNENNRDNQHQSSMSHETKEFFAWVAGIGGMIAILVGLKDLGLWSDENNSKSVTTPYSTRADTGPLYTTPLFTTTEAPPKPSFSALSSADTICAVGWGCYASATFYNEGGFGSATAEFFFDYDADCTTTLVAGEYDTITAGCHISGETLDYFVSHGMSVTVLVFVTNP